jgi:hypothetical protein
MSIPNDPMPNPMPTDATDLFDPMPTDANWCKLNKSKLFGYIIIKHVISHYIKHIRIYLGHNWNNFSYSYFHHYFLSQVLIKKKILLMHKFK